MNPGYFQTMIENEITGRYNVALEQNQAPFSFYIRLLYQMRFQNWFYLVPAGILLGFISKDNRLKRMLIFLILATGTYLLVISIGKTKLMWYDLPVFPFISILAGTFFYIIILLINHSSFFQKNLFSRLLPLFIVLSFFASPYHNIFQQNRSLYLPYQEKEIHKISHYLREARRENIQTLNNSIILYKGQFQHFLFYIYQLREKGYNIDFQDAENARSGKDYIVYQEELINELVKKHSINKYKLSEGIFLVELSSR